MSSLSGPVGAFFAGLLFLSLISGRLRAATPGSCLQFNGTNGYVYVAHDPALNAYPLTITAWIKTARNAPLYDGIVSKYPPGAYNGYSFFVWNGHVRAWYFKDASDYIWNPTGDAEGIDGGAVADGNWHHVALVVGPGGGSIYVDGNLGGNLAWTNTAGAPTTTVPLLLGQGFLSPPYTNCFAGQIDEVSFWNRALTPNELNYLKHRRLVGAEDGLLSCWRCNEGSGLTAFNLVTNAFNGTLTNWYQAPVVVPAWAPSQAAVVLDPLATNCLKFNGVDSYVSVAHTNDLQPYPLTVTAWVRTTRTALQVDGIATKYPDASDNGYAIFLYNGHVRAWYFKDPANYVWNPGGDALGIDGGWIADGDWHHVALMVDPGGGRLVIDGVQIQNLAWTGASPGPPTNTYPFQIGRYYSYNNAFLGSIDEVTVWKASLTISAIQAMKNLPRQGTEANLVAYWRLDEGFGGSTADGANHGHIGTLLNNPAWISSTAYLGDGSVHIVGDAGTPAFTRQYAIATATNVTGTSFGAVSRFVIRRFYDFGVAPPSVSVVTHADCGLQIAGSGTPVATMPDTVSYSYSQSAYNASTPQPPFAFGSVVALNPALSIQPAIQLDSVNNFHQGVFVLSHSENGGAFATDDTEFTAPAGLLDFDGNLYFGSVLSTFTTVGNTPTRGSLSGGGISTFLQVINNSGTIAAHPSLHYGSGTIYSVTLLPNGDAVAPSTAIVALTGSETDCAENICYTSSGLKLDTNNYIGTVTLQLPLGLSVCTNFSVSNRVTVGQVTFPNIMLDTNLVPETNSLVLPGPICAVEETKPFWMFAGSLNWQINSGQVLLQNPTGIQFVRQDEDDALTLNAASLVDTNTAKRVSNDAYYRNASNILSSPVTIVADANGVARMTAQIALNPPELRPHFPYVGNTPGNQIPTTSGGVLAFQDDLVDTANSFVPLSAVVPGIYLRDCADTNCSLATIAPGVLPFTPAGNQLKFTPEGGLLAYGTVPPGNLTWGYAGNGNYAQQAGPIQNAAYHMPGTFLRYDQSLLDPSQWPSVLLLSGYGDDSNPSYLERPGQDIYTNGFANYAGLNFRAPTTGRSFVAQQDTGPYSLTTRSKYYARFGGVSGIHEASAGFPSGLSLYGYPFTFNSYRLSYLDSQNWESRTDGAVSLPVPAGFQQEFSRMTFVCRGDLDSAQVPPFSPTKHMVYWNVDITPQSIEFKPNTNDVCGTSGRVLVMGVETRLPFLGQAFHTTLGFKNTGNLITAADPGYGVDSRFKVPGHLTLQGPGGSTFPLETAGDGYFNNWETSGKPTNGFFSVVGKLRVPFFSDIKVQLHVTPTGPNTAGIDMMGGWPSADGAGANMGWNIGAANYFNTAKFDLHNDGWPVGVPLFGGYRQSQAEQYHPRASRDWIQVAKFDYPLQWNSALHEFQGFVDAPVVLPVIDVNSRLKELSPGKVDFDFAQDITVQLPRLKVLDFANDALNELNGPIMTLSNSIRQEVGAALDTTGLATGFRSLQTVLREDSSKFFRPILQPVLAPVANTLYNLLAEMQRTNAPGLLTNVMTIVETPVNGLLSTIQTNLNGAAGQVNTVFGQLNQTLVDVDNTIGLFQRVLAKDPSTGQRTIVRVLVQKLVHDQGPALGIFETLGDTVLNQLISDLEPTLSKIETELADLRAQFQQLQAQIAGATGDFSSAVNSAVNNISGLQTFMQTAGQAVSNLLEVVVANNPDYFTADPAAATQTIEDRLILAFLGSPLPGSYQQTFRQFMYDDNFVLDQIMDALFDQINRSIREGLSDKIAGNNDDVFQKMKGIGQMQQSFLSAKIRGSPTFEGDSLRRIHLDAAVQMNLPDEMHFNAFMDIKELTSETAPLGCIPAGAPAAEVTLGAMDVPLNWAGVSPTQPLTLDIDARWTLQNGSVLGIGGLIDIKGEAGFKGCSVKEIGATLAIGQLENYFAAKAACTVVILAIPVDMDVGIFAGHACSLDPLRWVDTNADKILGNAPEFSGIYIQYGGDLDLAELLLGGASCFLDVRASITTAEYYLGGPRSGKIGFYQNEGIDLDLACVLSGHVDVGLGASVSYTPPTDYEIFVEGDARLCGSIGICPVCESGCKSITISGSVHDGHIDYHLE